MIIFGNQRRKELIPRIRFVSKVNGFFARHLYWEFLSKLSTQGKVESRDCRLLVQDWGGRWKWQARFSRGWFCIILIFPLTISLNTTEFIHTVDAMISLQKLHSHVEVFPPLFYTPRRKGNIPLIQEIWRYNYPRRIFSELIRVTANIILYRRHKEWGLWLSFIVRKYFAAGVNK